MLDELLHHEHIEVLTLSQISEVNGFYGNFIVTVTRRVVWAAGSVLTRVRLRWKMNTTRDLIYVRPFISPLPAFFPAWPSSIKNTACISTETVAAHASRCVLSMQSAMRNRSTFVN